MNFALHFALFYAKNWLCLINFEISNQSIYMNRAGA